MSFWDSSKICSEEDTKDTKDTKDPIESSAELLGENKPNVNTSIQAAHKGFPTEGGHINRCDMSYEAAWLGEISDLEDQIAGLNVFSLNKNQRKDYVKLVHYLAQNSFFTYLKLSFPDSDPLINGKHIRLLCNILTRAERGDYQDANGYTRLIITMPPRHLKSRTISETFPSWFMAKKQTRHVIACSYSADLGVKFGAKNKEKYETLGKEIFGAELSRESRAKSPWETSLGARFLGTGIGGSVTGFGANLLIIDDPFKNRQEADSEVIRNSVWSEWEDTLSTRLQGEKIVIVIHTRWHEDDLIGRLLSAENKNDWLLVNLPAECENPELDLLGRKEGEPLWPEIGYNTKYFEPIKIQRRTWAALYQQRPSIAGGTLFHATDFKYFKETPTLYILYNGTTEKRVRKSDCWSFQVADTALMEKKTSDYTAITHFVITPDFDILIRDVFMEKLEVPKQPQALVSYRTKWNANFQVVERKQSGIFLEQAFKNTNVPLRVIDAHTDKVSRCFEILTYYESGKVYHFADMPLLDTMENQLLKFPNVKHDDIVDTIAHAGRYLTDIEGNSGIWAASRDGR